MLWGTTGTAQTFAPPEAQPLTVGILRMIVGSLALLTFSGLRGSLKGVKGLPKIPTLLSTIGVAGYQLFFFEAVSRTGVAVGTVFTIGSASIIAGLLGWLFQKEHLERRWYLATGMAVLGTWLLLSVGGEAHVDGLGILLAAGAGFCYALFISVSKDILADNSADAVMAVVFSLGALLISPLLIGKDLSWLAQPSGLGVALHLGIFTAGVAYSLFSMGLRTVKVATSATLTLAEPLTAAILGIALLGERLTPQAFLGMGLLFAGLAILSVKNGGKILSTNIP
jgi:DME family drug/metabolite transporter